MPEIIKDISFLRQVSTPVESVEEAEVILKKLDMTLSATDNGVGLGAIQIGVPKRVALIKWNGKVLKLINPEVIEAEGEIIFVNEGCLSFPNVFRNTKRYRDFTFKHQHIEDGKFVEETHSLYYSADPTEAGNNGLESIAVQHEIDHFDGKLLVDYEEVKPEPIRRQKKVGRNDPCPCGSCKKFKKCCG